MPPSRPAFSARSASSAWSATISRPSTGSSSLDRKIDLTGLEVAAGQTFCWSGEYELNMNNRRTLSVALNVFEKFQPKLPESYRETPYVLLGNIAPSLQRSVCQQMRKPKFVVADTMDLWIGMARADLLELLKEVDMLILNDSEAKAVDRGGQSHPGREEDRGLGPRYVAVKKGRARLPPLRPGRRVFQHRARFRSSTSTIRPARAIALPAASSGTSPAPTTSRSPT
jgi:hypothetical protein